MELQTIAALQDWINDYAVLHSHMHGWAMISVSCPPPPPERFLHDEFAFWAVFSFSFKVLGSRERIDHSVITRRQQWPNSAAGKLNIILAKSVRRSF